MSILLCAALTNSLCNKCAFHSAFICSHYQGEELAHLYHHSNIENYIDMFSKIHFPKPAAAKLKKYCPTLFHLAWKVNLEEM